MISNNWIFTLYDVTHSACCSARYMPKTVDGSCSPANLQKTAFPVVPGGVMHAVEGCKKQDYVDSFVIAVEAEDEGRCRRQDLREIASD